jgi:hypothetical protein
MYFSTFSSYNSLSDEDTIENDIDIDENDICIICWLPSNEKNTIVRLNDYYTITTTCKCNPKIHSLCFNDWIQRTQTCPICRKNILIHIQYLTNNSVHTFTYIFVFFNFATRVMRFATIVSFINLFILCIYNLYIMYYLRRDYFDEY